MSVNNSNAAGQESPTTWRVWYRGGDYRIPAVTFIERLMGGRKAEFFIHKGGRVQLCVNSSLDNVASWVEYHIAGVRFFGTSSSKWVLAVTTKDKKEPVFELLLTFKNYDEVGEFGRDLGEAGIQIWSI